MESLAALGLATSIVQFVDFTSKLVNNSIIIYKSTSQASNDGVVLQDIVNDLVRLSNGILAPNRPGDESLEQLARDAKGLAQDLLTLLHDLRIKGKNTMWKSFRLAAKEVRSQRAIASIVSDIATLQRQIILPVQLHIRKDISSSSQKIKGLQSTNDRLQLGCTNKLKELRTGLLSAFNNINVSSQGSVRHVEHGKEALVFDTECLAIGDFATVSQKLPDYKDKITTLSKSMDSITSTQSIIESFYFDNLNARERNVSKAHAKTFEWIFRDVLLDSTTENGFPNWLRNKNGIFWIRGKAGSGKSTLMKFISHHRTTRKYLQRWSGSQKSILGDFYFWNSGTDLQKSQEGLLRSLIFKVLQQCPELVVHVQMTLLCMKERPSFMPISSQNDFPMPLDRVQPILEKIEMEGWTLLQLTEILGNLLDCDNLKKFCFFIDGLDEFKSQYTQDQKALIDLLHKMAASPNIKLCVSSRPWTVFVDAFDGDPSQHLKLEDLTKNDIRSYTTDKLYGHNQFSRRSQENSSYSSLIDEVVKKSQGVFLWVFLVVRELLGGLSFHDPISTMRRRLEGLPDNLEAFFQHMLDSIPKIYRPQAVRFFQVAAASDKPLPMMWYSLMDDIKENAALAAETANRNFDSFEIERRQHTIDRKLDAWCKGLLEMHESIIVPYHRAVTVDFIHRSAQDYILYRAVSGISEQPGHERLRTWLHLCDAVVLYYQRLPIAFLPDDRTDLSSCFMPFVHKAQKEGVSSHRINMILSEYWRASTHQGTNFATKIISEALKYGLQDSVQSIFSPTNWKMVKHISDIMDTHLQNNPDPEIVRFLISCVETRGLSSDSIYRSTFRSFMTSGVSGLTPDRLEAVLDILRIIASTDMSWIKTPSNANFLNIIRN